MDDAHWNRERETVDFTLRLRADAGEQHIICRVSQEALKDRARINGKIDLMNLHKRFRPEIWRAVDRKLKAGIYEADGSILVVSGDLKTA